MLLYTKNIQNSASRNMHTGLEMLLLDDPYLTLLKQRLGQLTTKLLVATFSPLNYLILNIRFNNTPGKSSEPQCMGPISNTQCGLR